VQQVVSEREAAAAAPRRIDDDAAARRARGSEQVRQFGFDVAAPQAELSRQRRRGTRLARQQVDQIAAKGHAI